MNQPSQQLVDEQIGWRLLSVDKRLKLNHFEKSLVNEKAESKA